MDNEINALPLLIIILSWLFIGVPMMGYREDSYHNDYGTCYKRGIGTHIKIISVVLVMWLFAWAILNV